MSMRSCFAPKYLYRVAVNGIYLFLICRHERGVGVVYITVVLLELSVSLGSVGVKSLEFIREQFFAFVRERIKLVYRHVGIPAVF